LDNIIKKLRDVVGLESVLSEPDELLVYECDGLPQHKYRPRAVVFPSTTEETSAIMRILAEGRVPFTPRGAGTGLSGGALALNQGVVVELARMRRILEIDEINRTAVVQPGVVNLHVSRAVAQLGLHYVPDPSSQPTCTIGGNIAESAGGIHCLKYGTTTDHVLGLRVVLAGGEIVDLGGGAAEQPGYDLRGVFIGSEGTFGIATEATLRLVPIAPAVRTMLAEFAQVNKASHAVSAIIAAGVMPAALEMMDQEIIRAVEASVFAAGLPLDVGAALLIELDGIEAGIDEEAERVRSICLQYGARDCRLARDENERKKLWAARKGAFGAIGRISPDSMIQDAVVPRSRLPEVLDAAYEIAGRYQLRIANVFHAGDGNLHPLICFDSRFPEEVLRVKEAGRELMETCVRAGGSITGEHGVGYDKRELLSLIFSEADMETMLRVRAAFDPTGLCNPGKIIPLLRGCGEARALSEPEASATGPSLESNTLSRPQASATGPNISSNVLSGPGASATGPNISSHIPSPPSHTIDPAQLASIVGESNISQSPISPAQLVVIPGSFGEVCEVMKLATSKRWTVLPAGAMTWLDAGQPPSRADILLSTRRLNRIIEHEPADLVAVAEAGVTLNAFNSALAENGQWLPLDPPCGARATLGGVVATGLGGAQQFGYGAPRSHVIGMKVVRADGTLVKAGGRVVKNVAGYDLCKLFTGSHGTFGVIVEVNFKLRPLPFKTSTTMILGTRDSLLTVAQRVIKLRLFPVAIELLSPLMSEELGWSDGKSHLLLIRFAGSATAVAAQIKAAGELVHEEHGSQTGPLADDDEIFWNTLAEVPAQVRDSSVWRVNLRPGDVGPFLVKIDRGQTVPSARWHAGIGDGRIRVAERVVCAENGAASRNGGPGIAELRPAAEALGGTLVIEQANGKMQIDTWGSLGPAGSLMQRIKQQLDPDGLLAPGHFKFGDARESNSQQR
jgi:glycolate oxidase subunit GlcD